MATFADYWRRLTVANPRIEESASIAFTPIQLQALLERTYAAGVVDQKKFAEDTAKLVGKDGGLFGDLLRGFGM